MITLTVTPDHGEPYKVTATSRDILTWEKTTNGKSFLDLMGSPNLKDLFRVAHLASWRQGLTTAKNLAEFEATCEVVPGFEDEAEDEEPDPTQSGPYPETSLPSPSAPESPRPSGRKKANAQS